MNDDESNQKELRALLERCVQILDQDGIRATSDPEEGLLRLQPSNSPLDVRAMLVGEYRPDFDSHLLEAARSIVSRQN